MLLTPPLRANLNHELSTLASHRTNRAAWNFSVPSAPESLYRVCLQGRGAWRVAWSAGSRVGCAGG